MKNYRIITPVVLIAFMALSFYMLLSDYKETNEQYYKYLEEARRLMADGITVDAYEYYNEALRIFNSLDICLEIGNCMVRDEEFKDAIQWGETIVKKYPKKAESYEFLADCYISAEEYAKTFALLEQADARKVTSERLSEILVTIDYKYKIKESSYTQIGEYSAGLCLIYKNDMWGYADTSGNLVIEPQYLAASPFLISVNVNGEEEVCAAITEIDGSMYFVDQAGHKKYIVKNLSNCTYIGPILNNVLVAATGDTYAYYDTEFNKLSGDFEYASVMNDDCAAVKLDDKWYLINSSFDIISDGYEEIYIDEKGIVSRGGRVFAYKNGKYCLLSNEGEQICTQLFDDVELYSSDGYAAIAVGDKWGFIDLNGNYLIDPVYEAAHSFINGYAGIKMNGKWGFITQENKLVIDYTFEDVRGFNSAGNVFVQQDGLWRMLSLYRYNY